MSFREKSAWISFVSILVIFSIYFVRVGTALVTRTGAGSVLRLFVVLVASLVVLELVLHVAIAVRSPRDARTPKDERERLIDMRATSLAFPVLLAGAFSSIGTLHLGAGSWVMAQVVLFAVVVSELVRFGAQIVYHRRGV